MNMSGYLRTFELVEKNNPTKDPISKSKDILFPKQGIVNIAFQGLEPEESKGRFNKSGDKSDK